MWRIPFMRTAAVVALALLPLGARGGVAVFQDPNATLGNPANPPATIPANGASVPLTLWYTPTDPNVSAPGTVCVSGSGGEVCGWDIHVSTSSPSIVLQSFTPAFDVVAAISGNVLRANGGDPINGVTSVQKIGTLTVAATSTGTINVAGNLYVTASLTAAPVTPGTLLATVTPGGADTDGDGVLDASDNCPTVPNGAAQAGITGVGNQTDTDSDGVGDACDNCVSVPNPRVTPNTASYLSSNQWATLTGDQRDDDHDGYGNKCDGKFPGVAGAAVGPADLTQFRTANNKARTLDVCGTSGTRPCAIFDLDELNTAIGPADLTQFRALNNKVPGPKCPTCPLACTAGTAGTCGAIP